MKTFGAAVAGFVVGVLVAVAALNLIEAGRASKNKRAMSEARNIVEALEAYRAQTGQYPPLDGGVGEAKRYLVPRFAKNIWQVDAYGRPYIVYRDGLGVAVVSTGRNGYVVRRNSVTLPADGSFTVEE